MLPQTIDSCQTCTWPFTTQSLSLTRLQSWHTSSHGCTWTDTTLWRRHTSTGSAICKSPAAKSRTNIHPTSQMARYARLSDALVRMNVWCERRARILSAVFGHSLLSLCGLLAVTASTAEHLAALTCLHSRPLTTSSIAFSLSLLPYLFCPWNLAISHRPAL